MFTVRLVKTAGRSAVLISRSGPTAMAPTPFRPAPRRLLTSKAEPKVAESAAPKEAPPTPEAPKGWWSSAEFWGGLGALAGWGMTGAAIYDASFAGPEKISLNMTRWVRRDATDRPTDRPT